MFSVTQRIASVSQPSGGYVRRNLFLEKQYEDHLEVKEAEAAFTSVQGTAVDYLTRFMISHDKRSAFRISIRGAELVDEVYENHDEYNRVTSLLEEVTGLDDRSIYAACKIVGYDTAVRAGVKTFRSVSEVDPPHEVITNIRTMVNRGITFLKKTGPLMCKDLTFEGGYTDLVSSGDADYIAGDTLIDFKVSILNLSNRWALQLLMYYLMGYHSVHPEYQNINFLCIFNPYKNKSYTCNINDISDETKYKVSNEVIGYKMCSPNYSDWDMVDGTDPNIISKLVKENSYTDFNIETYTDGISEISIDDYWTYLRKIDSQYSFRTRPAFKFTAKVLMIKNNGYVMFLSQSQKDSLCVLNGAQLRKATFSPEYYYANIERYADAVVTRFHKYWDALYAISARLKQLTPDKTSLRKKHYAEYVRDLKQLGWKPLKFDEWYEVEGYRIRLNGKVHGCIVDLDYFNHIYLNPYDGTVVPYSAESMYNKDVYKNTISLISAKRPEMLRSLQESCSDTGEETTALIVTSNDVSHALVSNTDVIENDFVKVYSHDMYRISRKMKPLQAIYDKHLIQVWYDEILNDKKKLLKPARSIRSSQTTPQYSVKDLYLGKTREQKGNHFAKFIAYRSFEDIDVEFEDGVILQHVHTFQWKNGNLLHPDTSQENLQSAQSPGGK